MDTQLDENCAYPLVADAHATTLNGDLVFLSVSGDAYFCLPGVGDVVELDLEERQLWIADPEVAEGLRNAGLVGSDDRGPLVGGLRPPPLPTESALRAQYGRPLWRDLGAMAHSLLDVAVCYRGKSFESLLKSAAVDRSTARSPTISPALLETVEDFHRWIPFAPVSGKCLLRSFMLLRLLRRRGHDALWVFGIRTWPFSAHCWLQCEHLVLDDEADRISAYTPIMVA